MTEKSKSNTAELQRACAAEDIAIKSLFLGPQSENAEWLRQEVLYLFDQYIHWRRRRFPEDGAVISIEDQQNAEFRERQKLMTDRLHHLMKRFESETPTFSPRYIGHMLSETTLPAILGHILTLLHNPNNVSKEVARVGLQIEKEAISDLNEMMGYDPRHARGHFTSGGTVANFEALWRARYRLDKFLALGLYLREKHAIPISLFEAGHMGWKQFHAYCERYSVEGDVLQKYSSNRNNPWLIAKRLEAAFGINYQGPVVLVPSNKHYSWQKGVSYLGLGDQAFRSIELDDQGRLSLESLRQHLDQAQRDQRPVLCVVSVAGTTELGVIDPLHEVNQLLQIYRLQAGLHFWHHVDAAYGGYFRTLLGDMVQRSALAETAVRALEATPHCDSITLDPHKLGYVPYACGAILVKNAENDETDSFSAPYLALPSSTTEESLVHWSDTLEGSRAASGATSTWLSNRCVGLNSHGYGRILHKGLLARDRLLAEIQSRAPTVRLLASQDTNVLCLAIAKTGESLSQVNSRTQEIYQILHQGPDFGVSKTSLAVRDYRALVERKVREWGGSCDSDAFTLIRLVLMNPFIVSKESKVDYLARFVDNIVDFAT